MFGRRRRDDPGTPHVRATHGARAAGPVPSHPGGPQYGTTTGWAPFGTGQAASEQTGAFDGQLLNQYPALVPGVQLKGGREGAGFGARWYYPSVSAIPNGSIQQTQRPTNLPGPQRDGSQFSGPTGPISARRNAALLAAAQVRQSGMAAMAWAANLTPGSGG